MDHADKIVAFLRASNPSASGGTEAILASTDLFSDGWLDSLLQLQLLAFLEKEFGARVSPFAAGRKSFLTVSAIAELARSAAK